MAASAIAEVAERRGDPVGLEPRGGTCLGAEGAARLFSFMFLTFAAVAVPVYDVPRCSPGADYEHAKYRFESSVCLAENNRGLLRLTGEKPTICQVKRNTIVFFYPCG